MQADQELSQRALATIGLKTQLQSHTICTAKEARDALKKYLLLKNFVKSISLKLLKLMRNTPTEDVINVLEEIFGRLDFSDEITSDNGLQFNSKNTAKCAASD